jgi:hypothetical protein
VLEIISVPKTGEVRGGCRKLLVEELHKLYSSADILRMVKKG